MDEHRDAGWRWGIPPVTTALRSDSWGRILLRAGWRSAQTASVLASALTSGGSGPIRLFYGGARRGDLGGPLVKVKRLSEHFPESRWHYNLVYLLSNAPYLSAGALDWLKRRKIPIVVNQNGVFNPGWYAGDCKKMNGIMAVAYHRADYVFWQSEYCQRAADHFLGKREGAGEVLFNAIDTRHRFRPAKVRVDRPFTFLLTGRIDAHMAYRLESSIAGLQVAGNAGLDCRLLVAGWVEDSVLAASQRLAQVLGVVEQVDFLGPYTQAEAEVIYQRADAYIMTKYLDPCPNTVIEAMACGLPVLYSASGGVPEQVGPDAGLGMPVPESWGDEVYAPSPEAIGAGMLEIARKATSMGLAARLRAESKFEIAHWIERHRQIFQHLLESKK
jgi:glycosyltransferase involved in cell wall biosynthesis